MRSYLYRLFEWRCHWNENEISARHGSWCRPSCGCASSTASAPCPSSTTSSTSPTKSTTRPRCRGRSSFSPSPSHHRWSVFLLKKQKQKQKNLRTGSESGAVATLLAAVGEGGRPRRGRPGLAQPPHPAADAPARRPALRPGRLRDAASRPLRRRLLMSPSFYFSFCSQSTLPRPAPVCSDEKVGLAPGPLGGPVDPLLHVPTWPTWSGISGLLSEWTFLFTSKSPFNERRLEIFLETIWKLQLNSSFLGGFLTNGSFLISL